MVNRPSWNLSPSRDSEGRGRDWSREGKGREGKERREERRRGVKRRKSGESFSGTRLLML